MQTVVRSMRDGQSLSPTVSAFAVRLGAPARTGVRRRLTIRTGPARRPRATQVRDIRTTFGIVPSPSRPVDGRGSDDCTKSHVHRQRSPAVGPQNQTNEQASRRHMTNSFCQDLYAADRSAQACSSDWVNISAD
jgi:hypothetical protein